MAESSRITNDLQWQLVEMQNKMNNKNLLLLFAIASITIRSDALTPLMVHTHTSPFCARALYDTLPEITMEKAALCLGIATVGYMYYHHRQWGKQLPATPQNSTQQQRVCSPMRKRFDRIKNLTSSETKAADSIRDIFLASQIGDTAGAVVEFLNAMKNIKEKFGLTETANIDALSLKNAIEYAKKYRITSSPSDKTIIAYSDDTLLAHAVARGIMSDPNQDNDTLLSSIAYELYSTHTDTSCTLRTLRAHGAIMTAFYPKAAALIKESQDIQTLITQKNWWAVDTQEVITKYEIEDTAGSGSVMRAWPIGIVFEHDPQKAIDLSVRQSRITHYSHEADAACAALTTGMIEALKKTPCAKILTAMIATAENIQQYNAKKPKFNFPQEAVLTIETINSFKKALIDNSVTVADMLTYVQKIYIHSQQTSSDRTIVSPDCILGLNEGVISGRTTTGALLGWCAGEALTAATYVFTRHATNKPEDTWNGIREAILVPGDSDTIGTIAGALLGAYQGFTYTQEETVLLTALEDYEAIRPLSDHIAVYKSKRSTKNKSISDNTIPLQATYPIRRSRQKCYR